MTRESDAKFEEKLTCGLENVMMKVFFESLKNWDFDGILLSKAGNV